jgi:hypothetical protein
MTHGNIFDAQNRALLIYGNLHQRIPVWRSIVNGLNSSFILGLCPGDGASVIHNASDGSVSFWFAAGLRSSIS